VESRLKNPILFISGYGDDERVEVSSTTDLNEVLDRIQRLGEREQPPIVDVEIPDQGTMRIGISVRGAVLSVMSSSLDPPTSTQLEATRTAQT
jgi:hypothetical protein